MKAAIQFSFLLFICLVSPATAQELSPLPGKAEQHVIQSNILRENRNYSIYLPKSYESNQDRKFPVLYLLHGMMDDHTGWTEKGRVVEIANQAIDAGDACEMIIIMPDAGTGQTGYFDVTGWAYETFFIYEFIPYIEKTYRVLPGKAHRAIAGLSLGGGGTVVYAQKHTEKFSSAYAMSALVSLPKDRRAPAGDKRLELLNQSVIANDCINYVTNAGKIEKTNLRQVRWMIDCGDDDYLLEGNFQFYQEMVKAGIPCQLRIRDGGHSWTYWQSALYEALRFVSVGFGERE